MFFTGRRSIKEFYTHGFFWRDAIYRTGGTTWTAPANVRLARVFLAGAGGAGGNTTRGSQNDRNSAGGGGSGGLAIKTFRINPGQTVNYAIGQGANGSPGGTSTLTFAPQGVNLTAQGGRLGQNNQNGGGPGGNGGTASGGDINRTGGKGRTGNATSGRGGAGGAINGIDTGAVGFMPQRMGNEDLLFFALGLAGQSTNFESGYGGQAFTAPDPSTGGGGAGRTRTSNNNGRRGADGFVVIMWGW